MAKNSGNTRRSSVVAPRGVSGKGFYTTYTDEDTGEKIRVWVSGYTEEEYRKRQADYEREYDETVSKLESESRSIREQTVDNALKQLAAERELDSLRETRQIFESDMEDELGRLSGAAQDRRASFYGSKLNSLDRQIASKQRAIERYAKTEERLQERESKLYEKWDGELEKVRRKYRM